ncbi:MAG: hypothetical protein ACR2M4_13855 [Actinomycetota bacterium]
MKYLLGLIIFVQNPSTGEVRANDVFNTIEPRRFSSIAECREEGEIIAKAREKKLIEVWENKWISVSPVCLRATEKAY